VVLVEPTNNLMMQSLLKLEQLDYKLKITTMRNLFEDPIVADVIILNEYDLIVSECSYEVRPKCIRGLWELKGRRVFAFSATSSKSHERLLNDCISEPKIMKFKNEYEMVRGTSPIVDPTIHSCKDESDLIKVFEEELIKFYEQQPIIIVATDSQRDKVLKILSANKFKT
jgi:hypothetical protein